MNWRKLLAALTAAVWLVLLPAGVDAAEIKRVDISIESDTALPPRILRRIEASVRTVGERLLVGRDSFSVEQACGSYEESVREVLDRVLAGYSVREVAIAPAAAAGVRVALEPWEERIREVQVEVVFSAVDPAFVPLLRAELGELEPGIRELLLGLPVDSLDWADTITKNTIREQVEARLPEYRAAVDIVPGKRTQLRLIFSPVGAVVREAVVSLRSDSMPNLLLYQMRPELDAFARSLRGLPVEFISRRQQELTRRMEQIASAHPYTASYQLNVRGELLPGQDTQLNLQLDSIKYRVYAEARLDLGRDDGNTSGLLHVGKFVSGRDEAFVEVELLTDNMEWQFSPGWGRRIGPNTVVGARFNLTDNARYAWLEHRFGSNWRLRFDRSSEDRDDEIGLRYKLHDFLGVELVHRSHENFLRVIGQL
ncbi:MAG: hypothetical protein E6X17_09735 [Sporomusaceae bacterium]|nr:hypothetical protein [Sporomusaceae bacterium]